MIHYNVWFTFKEGVEECRGLAVLENFLCGLAAGGEAAGFRLLKNQSGGTRTKLPAYQAVIEFADEAALAEAMKRQATRGIHQGAHGRVVDVVSEFRVEIFRVLAEGFPAMQYACEI
jgi:hypothetical protein